MVKTPVSFIISAYKELYLKEAVESIISQTYPYWELIIVNDNPKSKIKSIVNDYLSDKRIRYFENGENIGGQNLIKQWNNCLQYVNTNYFVLASDDDIYEPDYLAEMVLLTEQFPNVDLFHCRIKYIDHNGETLQISQPAQRFESSVDFIYQRLFWNRKQSLQEFMFKTCSLLNKGGFVDFPLAWYSDDATLSLMSSNGVAYSEKTMFKMRLSGISISTNDIYKERKLTALKRYIKWLDNFLPTLRVENQDDAFMKDKLIAEYKPILNYLRLTSIKSLPLKIAFQEYQELYLEKCFPKRVIAKQIIKKTLDLC